MKRWVLVGCMLLSGCARRDFAGLCKLASEILGEPRITPAMRFERFEQGAPNVAFSRSVREVVDTLSQLQPVDRYPALLGAARSQGLETWACPALESVLAPQL